MTKEQAVNNLKVMNHVCKENPHCGFEFDPVDELLSTVMAHDTFDEYIENVKMIYLENGDFEEVEILKKLYENFKSNSYIRFVNRLQFGIQPS